MKIKFAVLLAFLITTVSTWAQDNKFDDKGKRHGKWGDVYDTTKLPRYEGAFNHGKETGVFKFYQNDKNSTLIATRDFSAGNGVSYTIFYDEKGKKLSEGKEVNRLREGEWKFYHPGKEAILSIEQYSKGKLTGMRKVYFPNGNIAEEAQYKDGLKNGVYKKYTEDGTLLEESTYKNDVLHGMAIFRDATGEISSKGEFKNNIKTGVWEYFENGKLVKEEDKTNLKIELKRIRE
ncbi:toxin-antitoxin system YwqK family antitoxin [Flavobacterium arcticum]|uniref:Toxin-antitoxin system YwqK family antitoxin n=1 Tax=Flavobacterium arcticum TaxID=1784713 RepID=A0A345HER1_9FLAO|nr:toxin-antitoxin system YwqK family antitoxin [Flavobacterium arcticum]AXG75071.1 toxin-antitoxin system YwqK family antitoxin [Flavobacterium arcticum]KAF2511148.1 toxin-antitoxin system YwqK family antitoxin [Flavobacterium arcticum]